MDRVRRPRFETKPRGKKAPPQRSVESESDSEPEFSDSDVEEFLEIKEKDTSRRKTPGPKPKSRRDVNKRPVDYEEEENPSEAEEPKAQEPGMSGAHALFAQALAFRTGFNTVTYHDRSEYIPDLHAAFDTLNCMVSIVSENTLLHERYPAYSSVALVTFYAHAAFYQVLRVRDDAGVLTREERRSLRKYQAVAPPESWEIAPPMIPFIQALGSIIPQGGKYGRIVPSFPDYNLHNAAANNTLAMLANKRSVGRLPVIPALHQFLHNFGSGEAAFTEGVLYPRQNPVLSATNLFLGTASSANTGITFNTLAFSAGWMEPAESETDTYTKILDQKRAIIRRWRIPDLTDARDITGIETFLGLDDATDSYWMKNLLTCSAEVNKYFPGAVSMANIPLITRQETVSKISITTATRRTAVDNEWYKTRREWKYSLEGKLVREDAQQQYQMSLTTCIRPFFETNMTPASISASYEDRDFAAGQPRVDYFNTTTAPPTEMECLNQPDPIEQALLYIQTKMYDNLGGRK